tara:strand:+ start:176 stop:433 length:258 start_codon:yes stop_codon:yes gene_type:complete
MSINKGKLYEINEITAPFYAREYFLALEKGEELSIYELVDLIHKNNFPEISLIKEDKEYHRDIIKTIIYATLIEIAKKIYQTYEK